jgi:phosphoglycolate phosphatase
LLSYLSYLKTNKLKGELQLNREFGSVIGNRRFDAVLFDLDGTLLDTLTDIALSVNYVLKINGFPEHPVSDFRMFVGDGMEMLLMRALPVDARLNLTFVNQCVAAVKTQYAVRWSQNTFVYDGITDLLQTLVAEGIHLAILSNKPHDFTVSMVDYYFSGIPFEMVLGAGAFPEKPDPSSALHIAQQLGISTSEFIYVGDSSVDMKTACASGMFAVGVEWGFRDRNELLANGADLTVKLPSEINELFKRI